MNLEQYLPILLFILVGIGVGVVPQALGYILGPRRPDAAKDSPYECGFEAFEDARMKFDVRYYLVAILFILFDLEIAFLFPWGAALKDVGLVGFASVLVFLGILEYAELSCTAVPGQALVLVGVALICPKPCTITESLWSQTKKVYFTIKAVG